MYASFEAFLSGKLHFSQVLNCENSVKNVSLAKAKKKQAIFRKERDVIKTGLKKSQKTTEIFFDEASPWITVNTYNTDLKNKLTSYSVKHPDLCKLIDDTEDGGLSFEIAKGRFCFRLTEPYSDERRAAASKCAKKQKNSLLKDITRSDIQTYVNQKFECGRSDGKGGLSSRSVKIHLIIIRQVFKEAVKSNLIMNNPCDYISLPKAERYDAKFYSAKQLNELFTAIKDEPLYPLIYFTAVFGLRRSEVLGLKWDSVDLENNTITVKHTVVRFSEVIEKDTTKNAASYRTYPLSAEAKAILLDLKGLENEYRMDSFERRIHFLFGAGKAEVGMTVAVFDFQFNHGKSPLRLRVRICGSP